ncbi:uncharacterized protein LOC120267316 [Dioscorea cayenensis subsp. rotundata]|uniref:Uncharacterized protein LOC120267316 n=1 Tax=Dioscorea cayennensis subsp. rotundata TaxID=55577 RepID=A0AB40BU06_DIOCR|nr:uncharacterized protein LOC120267316 [Dioscorea cayenensis subsp. rotundata]
MSNAIEDSIRIDSLHVDSITKEVNMVYEIKNDASNDQACEGEESTTGATLSMDDRLKPSIEELPVVELKTLQEHLEILFDPFTLEDQEKTTFTCLYGTFAYRRIPFRLYNLPATFQRCMLANFEDMVEKTMEVFMDDFSEFDVEIKDKRGVENLVADHLFRLEGPKKIVG